LRPLGTAVLARLEAINHRVNGPEPSTRTDTQDTAAIAQVAYPIACVIEAVLKSHRRWSLQATFDQSVRDELDELVHRTSYAWCQVLAGDIDDLLEGFDD
jgi:hypothetical protein